MHGFKRLAFVCNYFKRLFDLGKHDAHRPAYLLQAGQ